MALALSVNISPPPSSPPPSPEKSQEVPDIHLTSLSSSVPTQDHLITHSLDLTDPAAVNALIQELQPDEVYHLASIAQVGSSFNQARDVLTNNFALQLNLLEALAQFAPHAHILVVSSAAIYDVTRALNPPLVDEICPLGPNNPYAASKAIQDLMSASYAASSHLHLVRARPFNHIGPGQGRGFAVADFASQIVEAQKNGDHLITTGNLSPRRDFTDVRDVVAAYILLMQKGQSGSVYNIGSGKSVAMSDILARLLDLAHASDIKITTDPALVRPVDTPDIVCDNSRLAALGWQPHCTLERTLQDIINYWENLA